MKFPKRSGPEAEPVKSDQPDRIGSLDVYETVTGRSFVISLEGGKLRRQYGEASACERCKKPFFRLDRDRKRGHSMFCSVRCSKLGANNPMTRRPQRSPKGTADKLFSLIIRKRGRCENCDKPSDLECAHGFSRRYVSTRWDEANAFCLCHFCHVHFTSRPLEWEEWMRKRIGSSVYDELRRKALIICKPDYNALLPYLRSRLDQVSQAA